MESQVGYQCVYENTLTIGPLETYDNIGNCSSYEVSIKYGVRSFNYSFSSCVIN